MYGGAGRLSLVKQSCKKSLETLRVFEHLTEGIPESVFPPSPLAYIQESRPRVHQGRQLSGIFNKASEECHDKNDNYKNYHVIPSISEASQPLT